ncbi:MAG: XkdX family protein [Eubacteriales bacterium]|nr:XkdX family protein [Eubacteriales bacterium]
MRMLIESLKRLYRAGKVGDEKIDSMMQAGTITQEEAEYIVTE